jgi:hypothetical protein
VQPTVTIAVDDLRSWLANASRCRRRCSLSDQRWLRRTIWEDVFQGVYWDAYANLTPAEKLDLLTSLFRKATATGCLSAGSCGN